MKVCSVEGCESPNRRRGLCSKHSDRFYRHGDTSVNLYPGRGGNYLASLEARINKSSPTGCWFWTGAVDGSGYGSIRVGPKATPVHRLAYTVYVGPIPPNMVIDHLCRNRICCNPDHLEAVSALENARRTAKPYCIRGHRLTEDNLRISPTGKRECRLCILVRGAENRAKSRQLRTSVKE